MQARSGVSGAGYGGGRVPRAAEGVRSGGERSRAVQAGGVMK